MFNNEAFAPLFNYVVILDSYGCNANLLQLDVISAVVLNRYNLSLVLV